MTEFYAEVLDVCLHQACCEPNKLAVDPLSNQVPPLIQSSMYGRSSISGSVCVMYTLSYYDTKN